MVWYDKEGEEHSEVVVKGKKIKVGEDGRPITCMGGTMSYSYKEDEELGSEDATLYRSVVARFNYLAPDRQDIQFAVRECAKAMAKPTVHSMVKLKRIGRYLLNCKRCKTHLWVQPLPDTIDVHTDSDWAGCKRTRISVSGGVIRLGCAVVRSWSKDQQTVAKISAEAELYAANYGGEQALGMQTMLKEMGHEARIVVHIDSSAAIGVLQRKGIGKIRHLDVADLWMQSAIRKGKLMVEKVDGAANDADLLTKPLAAHAMHTIMERLGTEHIDWEHEH